MEDLLARVRDYAGAVKRNVVSRRTSTDLFARLAAGDAEDARVAAAAEALPKLREGPPDPLSRGFLYAAAIGYPFSSDHWMQTRYSDGSFPAWYGALELDTTIHETAYHMMRFEFGREGSARAGRSIVRERCVYDVGCRAVLIDLTGKERAYPDLIHPRSYAFTQQVGKRLWDEGHPGLLAPSARRHGGVCLAAFKQKILGSPRISCYLTYTLDVVARCVRVERKPGKLYLTVHG
jgi:hypothetical protein